MFDRLACIIEQNRGPSLSVYTRVGSALGSHLSEVKIGTCCSKPGAGATNPSILDLESLDPRSLNEPEVRARRN